MLFNPYLRNRYGAAAAAAATTSTTTAEPNANNNNSREGIRPLAPQQNQQQYKKRVPLKYESDESDETPPFNFTPPSTEATSTTRSYSDEAVGRVGWSQFPNAPSARHVQWDPSQAATTAQHHPKKLEEPPPPVAVSPVIHPNDQQSPNIGGSNSNMMLPGEHVVKFSKAETAPIENDGHIVKFDPAAMFHADAHKPQVLHEPPPPLPMSPCATTHLKEEPEEEQEQKLTKAGEITASALLSHHLEAQHSGERWLESYSFGEEGQLEAFERAQQQRRGHQPQPMPIGARRVGDETVDTPTGGANGMGSQAKAPGPKLASPAVFCDGESIVPRIRPGGMDSDDNGVAEEPGVRFEVEPNRSGTTPLNASNLEPGHVLDEPPMPLPPTPPLCKEEEEPHMMFAHVRFDPVAPIPPKNPTDLVHHHETLHEPPADLPPSPLIHSKHGTPDDGPLRPPFHQVAFVEPMLLEGRADAAAATTDGIEQKPKRSSSVSSLKSDSHYDAQERSLLKTPPAPDGATPPPPPSEVNDTSPLQMTQFSFHSEFVSSSKIAAEGDKKTPDVDLSGSGGGGAGGRVIRKSSLRSKSPLKDGEGAELTKRAESVTSSDGVAGAADGRSKYPAWRQQLQKLLEFSAKDMSSVRYTPEPTALSLVVPTTASVAASSLRVGTGGVASTQLIVPAEIPNRVEIMALIEKRKSRRPTGPSPCPPPPSTAAIAAQPQPKKSSQVKKPTITLATRQEVEEGEEKEKEKQRHHHHHHHRRSSKPSQGAADDSAETKNKLIQLLLEEKVRAMQASQQEQKQGDDEGMKKTAAEKKKKVEEEEEEEREKDSKYVPIVRMTERAPYFQQQQTATAAADRAESPKPPLAVNRSAVVASSAVLAKHTQQLAPPPLPIAAPLDSEEEVGHYQRAAVISTSLLPRVGVSSKPQQQTLVAAAIQQEGEKTAKATTRKVAVSPKPTTAATASRRSHSNNSGTSSSSSAKRRGVSPQKDSLRRHYLLPTESWEMKGTAFDNVHTKTPSEEQQLLSVDGATRVDDDAISAFNRHADHFLRMHRQKAVSDSVKKNNNRKSRAAARQEELGHAPWIPS